MSRKFRLFCLIIALLFAAVFIVGIVMSVALADEAEDGCTRGETVYISAEADGTPREMVSSVYISNPDGLDTVSDHTTLTDIKNITGSEAPVIDGETITFKAGGEDVCYQGTASGTLPFSVKIRYFLDGEEIAPEDIAGKSGKVRIEVHTTNNLLRRADVDGEMMELYVPFSVIVMMTLGDSFTAVEADGAKLSAQAGRITVLSVLLPGLATSLGVTGSERIKDSFSVEANAEDFALDSMMFIGMTGIIDENDLSGIDDIQGLMSALDEISAASSALYKGSRKLYYGAGDFYDGLEVYTDGVSQSAQGAGEASDGAGRLADALGELSGGISQLAEGISKLSGGVDEAVDIVNDLTDPNAPVDEATKNAVEDMVNGFVHSYADEIKQQIRTSLDEQLKSSIPDDTLRAAVVDAVIAGIDLDNMNIQLSDENVIAIRNAILATAQVRDMIAQLNELRSGVDSLEQGANTLDYAAATLSRSMNTLAKGLAELAQGLAKLDENSEALMKGAKALVRGLNALTDGLKALSEEGLQNITDETDKIEVSLSRKDALLTLSEGYNSFTCTSPSVGDTVQFMLTTDEIVAPEPILPTGVPDETEQPAAEDETDPSFFESIGAWFSGAWETIKGLFE